MTDHNPVNIALFASGSGTNVENIARYFENSVDCKVQIILSNKPDAYALERAKKLKINSFVFTKHDFYESEKVIQVLKENKISWIILCGFLWLVPENLIESFPKRIINIHPALLPKYGGKGMYGMRVHEAVINNGDNESGITIHYVNNEYDKGNVIFQARCRVEASDTAESLAEKVHQLEYVHFPKVIENVIKSSVVK